MGQMCIQTALLGRLGEAMHQVAKRLAAALKVGLLLFHCCWPKFWVAVVVRTRCKVACSIQIRL
jgi:hypothetical protein